MDSATFIDRDGVALFITQSNRKRGPHVNGYWIEIEAENDVISPCFFDEEELRQIAERLIEAADRLKWLTFEKEIENTLHGEDK